MEYPWPEELNEPENLKDVVRLLKEMELQQHRRKEVLIDWIGDMKEKIKERIKSGLPIPIGWEILGPLPLTIWLVSWLFGKISEEEYDFGSGESGGGGAGRRI